MWEEFMISFLFVKPNSRTFDCDLQIDGATTCIVTALWRCHIVNLKLLIDGVTTCDVVQPGEGAILKQEQEHVHVSLPAFREFEHI